MISSLKEVLHAKELAKELRDNLRVKKDVPLGIMIEPRASAIISHVLEKEVHIFSIGTNDLTQYTLVIDRQNDSLAYFCDTHHKALLRFIRLTCENVHKAGIWVGICGSLGVDLTLTKDFVEMGLDEVSEEPSCILKLLSLIAEC